MTKRSDSSFLLPPSSFRSVDQVCDRFEDAWLAGQRPPVEHYLGDTPEPERSVLLRELLTLDLDYRRRAGECPTTAEYRARFPAHGELIDALLPDGPPFSQPQSSPGVEESCPAVLDSRTPGLPAFQTSCAWQPSIPGYEILGLLGQGAMGVVYRARHLGLNRTVALKMILAGAYAGDRERARFRAEAEAVAQLRHPNIVQVYDIGEAEGKPFFSLELVEGGSLADRLNGTPLPAHQAAALVETLARAMHAAHLDGIIHRDLKPANILLTPDGTPKVTDFGLAKQLDRGSGQTRSGAVLGTPSYMAPEQAAGKAHAVGPRADVYALGAILYQALTGRPPFRGSSVLETLEQVRSQEPVPPRRLHPRVDRDLETICLKCLEKDPARRYQSAAELAADLHRFLQGEPIEARPITVWEQSVKWTRRYPTVAALAGGIVLVTVVAFVLVSWKWREAEGQRREAEWQRREAEAERRRKERLLFRISLQNGSSLCQQGEIGKGMLWLAHALEAAHQDCFSPEEAAGLRRALRANLAAWRGQLHSLRHVLPHPAPLEMASFSPDGRMVLTVSGGTTARLWDAESGTLIGRPLRHPDSVLAVCFSPDSRLVLTGCADGAARLWRTRTSQPVGQPLKPPGPARAIRTVAFHPNSRTLATAGDDPRIWLWEVPGGPGVPPGGPGVPPGGPGVLPGAQRPAGPTQRPLRVATGHKGPVLALAFRPDGLMLASASEDGTARQWQAATLEPGPSLPPLGGEVWAVSFSPPHGRTLLTVSKDQAEDGDSTVRLWESATGRYIATLQHNWGVEAVAFSPNGQLVVTGGEDHTARLWKTSNGRPIGKPMQHQDAVLAVAFSPDGRTLLTRSHDLTARLWNADSGRPIGQPLEHEGPVGAVAFSPDGRTILTTSGDRTARLWDVSTDRPYRHEFRHKARVMAVAVSPDERTLATGSGNRVVRWCVSGAWLDTLSGHEKDVWTAAFTPDGKTLLTGSRDKTARLWDVATGQVRATLEHTYRVRSVAFSPDGGTILTGSGDTLEGEARFWDASTGASLGPPLEQQGVVWAVAYHPDGRMVATASGDNTVRLYDTATRETAVLAPLHKTRVVALAFSPNGRLLVTGSTDRTARLWDTDTRKPIGAPLQHQGAVWSVAFSPDGQTLVTGGTDRGARLWDVATGTPIGPPWPHRDVIWAVACHPDGRDVFTGSEDGTVRLWDMPVPVEGEVERIRLWTQVITALELDESGVVRWLDAPTWEQRRRRLEELGGPPMP